MIKRGNLQSEINQYQVISLLRKQGQITRPELVRVTGLSRPTIDKIVDFFKELRIINETRDPLHSPKSGRRPVLLSLDGTSKVVIGVNFECPRLEIIITDMSLNVLDGIERHLGAGEKANVILGALRQDIKTLLARRGKTARDLLGIGVALPGVIDVRKGVSLQIERLANWNNVHIAQLLRKDFDVPVLIDNDANLMALAEKNLHNGALPKSFIYVSLVRGVGAAVFIDGSIFRGNLGNAGFLGHTTIDPQGPLCRCGNHGCLELYAGDLGIIESAKKQLREMDDSSSLRSLPLAEITPGVVYDAAGKGDTIAISALDQTAQMLGIGIANMICLFDIGYIVLGGDTVKGGQRYIKQVQESASQRLEMAFRRRVAVRFSTINEHAAALGATLLVLEDVFGAPELPLVVT